ncbi:hypothetical protein GOZ92_25910 [Agrobacterium vitis]|nr:ABC transporter substrate-binding protein [Agrobacterium vitis]MVA27839.1 hypothetical protein [Agrobacterium vitis]
MPSIFTLTQRCCLTVSIALFSTTTITATARAEFDLRVVQGSDVDTLDPAVARNRPSQVVYGHIFNKLVRWKDTKLSEIVPDLAESWSKSADGLKWTFKLRKGVTFQDDTSFNAEAVKFNLDRINDPALGSPNRSLFEDIAKVTVIDDSTVEITTKKPSPTLLEVLAEPYSSISSPVAVQKNGRAYSRNPVGTGPYSLAEWIPGQKVVLKRNPNYFDAAGKADTITFRPVPEGSARVIELETGNADIALSLAPDPPTKSSSIKQRILWSSRVLFRSRSISTLPSRLSMIRASGRL